ncbi:MAG: SufD family Fe-S cluster assembly protein [Lachnospiraceae bacterium]|nr:SufD family Fe-S cluster assembly protein [Lachnospiraceae bacterium]MBR1524339.1 SufD family Fe-S cluster assembly protein [Lachnospiraceae bacterium]
MMRVNSLKSLTWNSLKLNDAVIEDEIVLNGSGRAVVEKIPSGVTIGNESCQDCGGCDLKDSVDIKQIKCGMGAEADAFFMKASSDVLMVHARAGRQVNEPVSIRYLMENGDSNADRVEILAEEGSRITVIMDYSSSKSDAAGFFGVQTKIRIARDASVHLVKVNLLGQNFMCMDDIGVEIEDNGSFDITQMCLGGKRNLIGLSADLKGCKARFNGDMGYLCLNTQELDMNYYIAHHGRRSESELQVKGALRDSAKKNFRGTIDLVRGAKGAVGDELEDVLLLSEGVVNKTLPVILCDEEDVEGSHGASIGRLSADMLYYMQTRGFSKYEAELLATKAKLNSVRNLIKDEHTHGRIQYYMEEAFK